MAGKNRFVNIVAVLGMALVCSWATAAAAEIAKVTITGGADETQHNYSWQVTNHHNSRLVYIEFPHYAADLFHTPDSWSQKVENLAAPGWKDRPGTCIATPASPYPGLAPGGTAQFGIRIGSRGALQGRGEVLVKFEDGTEATIAGVELPQQPERGTSYLALIGTGAIFIAFIIYNERRRRKSQKVEE